MIVIDSDTGNNNRIRDDHDGLVRTPPRWSLKGKNFIVTGGTQGIGKAVVKSLIEHEAGSVMICSRSRIDNDAFVESLGIRPVHSGIIRHFQIDISTNEGRKLLAQRAGEHLSESGGVHGLVNNVGINVRKPILEQTPDEYRSMMTTNVDAAYFLCRECSPHFSSDGATIVNVSSAAGVQSSGTGAAYGMTKAAINHFTKILACEWASRKIRVNAVTPWMTVSSSNRTTFENENLRADIGNNFFVAAISVSNILGISCWIRSLCFYAIITFLLDDTNAQRCRCQEPVPAQQGGSVDAHGPVGDRRRSSRPDCLFVFAGIELHHRTGTRNRRWLDGTGFQWTNVRIIVQ